VINQSRAAGECHEIIVVEDDASMSQAIERLLNAAGWRTRAFDSAEKLLDCDGVTGADCFVFDMQLPGLNGLQLCARLRERGINQPVFFITAYDQDSTREQVSRSTAAGYFPKPFDGRQLIAAIKKATMGAA
jgi:FixJ family two-component response regulator